MQRRRFCIALPLECYETDYVCSITHPDNVSTTLSVREMENISLPSGNIKIHSLETSNFPPHTREENYLISHDGLRGNNYRVFVALKSLPSLKSFHPLFRES